MTIKIPRWFELTVLATLALGAVLSLAAAGVARLWLAPLLSSLDMHPPLATRLAMAWGFHLFCILLPLGTLAACLLLTRRAVARVIVAFIIFHVWLVAFLFTAVGICLPFLGS